VKWFLSDLPRVTAERIAIETLAAEADWLTDLHWGFDQQARLRLQFTIVVGQQSYALWMTYPDFFPFTPPDISPVESDRRLSSHQYPNGNLCLEYRPDNWEPHFTGADLIRSAHRLISTEHPAEGPPQRVQSAHSLTKGQELRSEPCRYLVTADIRQFINTMTEDLPLRAEVRLVSHASSSSAFVSKLSLADGSEWVPRGIPKIGYAYRGILVRLGKPGMKALIEDSTGGLARHLRNAYAEAMPTPLVDYADREFIIATDGADIHLIWQLARDKEQMTQFITVDIDDDVQRLPPGYEILSDKKVALVGCGSIGSKVAVSLARSGVGHFFLVDDDILVRKNLVRNDLDWRSMGGHKADGVAKRVRMVNPEVTVKSRHIHLSGQESAASAAAVLAQIAECDLIVDATADPRVFNLLSSVSVASIKPMVWCEVFAGGIGGLVARHRPGADHPPQTMRAILRTWFREQDVPWTGGVGTDYGNDDPVGTPLVADDGDVSVIAAHASRMATDILLDGTTFPHSMYVLGLKNGWKFDQPFEAYPIEGADPFVAKPLVDLANPSTNEAIDFLSQLFEAAGNETAPARQD
jgi:hypothetical protein